MRFCTSTSSPVARGAGATIIAGSCNYPARGSLYVFCWRHGDTCLGRHLHRPRTAIVFKLTSSLMSSLSSRWYLQLSPGTPEGQSRILWFTRSGFLIYKNGFLNKNESCTKSCLLLPIIFILFSNIRTVSCHFLSDLDRCLS